MFSQPEYKPLLKTPGPERSSPRFTAWEMRKEYYYFQVYFFQSKKMSK
jgi:hypothetical protein